MVARCYSCIPRDRNCSDGCSFQRNTARGKDRIAHAMNDLFVCGANGREHPAELGARSLRLADNKIVRAEPDAALHRYNLLFLKIKPFRFDESRFVIAWKDVRRAVELVHGLVNGGGPVRVRKVASQVHATRAPRMS